MKKKLVAFCMLVISLAFSVAGGLTAFADVSLEECDRCFENAVNGFLENDDVDGNKVNAVRYPVYDLNLLTLGYVYEFELLGGNGYAIIICDDGNYIAQEFVPFAENPYAEVEEDELCVYINSMTYLKHNGTSFCDIHTSQEVPEDVIQSLMETAILYKDSDYVSTEREVVTVTYTGRTSKNNVLSKRIPCYYNPSDLLSSCAAVAGTNIVGFYDRYYDNLIPNFTAGFESYGYYLYNLKNSYVDDAMREMYSDMNGTADGISEDDFKNGLQKYCNKRNLSCDFTSLLSSGKLDFDAVVDSIDINKPIALLLSSFTVCELLGYNGYDEHVYDIYTGNHIMTGFGYCDLYYTITDGSRVNYRFIYTATGFMTPTVGYFNISYKTNINNAYQVDIH